MKIRQDTSLFPSFLTHNIRLAIIVISCAILNMNTLGNKYALDDEMVIHKNRNMQMGLEGIGRIMGTDAYQGYLDDVGANTPLAGGRYRPLSIVTFAIEEQLFGEPLGKEYLQAKKQFDAAQSGATNITQVEEAAGKLNAVEARIKRNTLELAPVRHLFQVIWFTLSMLVLFWFLDRFILSQSKDVAFLATLIFVFHPVHTEVIANIKSRDEILSLLFILLSCGFVFKYQEDKKNLDLLLLFIFSLGAFFSKEYAVILPVIAFCAVVTINRADPLKVIRSPWFLLLAVTDALFLMLRHSIVGKNKQFTLVRDVMNEPYMYATAHQRIATKIATLIEYPRLLLFPHPLSSDYSYRHFPYLTFSDWKVWVSIVTWMAVLYLTYRLWQKRHVLAFALIFFLGFFMLINNMLFPIGATIGERLIYHSSLGFCMIVAWLIVEGTKKIKSSPRISSAMLTTITLCILLPMGYKTIARNPDWKNDFTLFTRDVKYIDNSALTNGNAGAEYFNQGYRDLAAIQKPTHKDSVLFLGRIDTAIMYLNRALDIHPRYVGAYINRALCYLMKGKMDSSIVDWKRAAGFFSGRNPSLIEHAKTLLQLGKNWGSEKDYKNAARALRDAAIIDPGSAEIWDNLGGSEFMQGQFSEAEEAFRQALSINPNLQDAKQGYLVASNFAILEEKCRKDSLNPQVWIEAGNGFRQSNFAELSNDAYRRALDLDPGNKEAVKALGPGKTR